MENYERDKSELLNWMNKFCYGFRKARTRNNIQPYTLLYKQAGESKDRYWRSIISDLIHEGHIASHNSLGYWFIPTTTNDPEEIEAVLKSYREREAKAISMLEGVREQIKAVKAKIEPQLV